MLLPLLLAAVAHAAPTPADPEALVRDLYQGLDTLDLKVPLHDESFVAFVGDEAGAPIRLAGPEGAARFRALLAGWKADGYTLGTRIDTIACVTDRRLAWCAATLTQDLLQHGERLDTLTLRATVGARRHGTTWSVAHLHESPGAKAPAP